MSTSGPEGKQTRADRFVRALLLTPPVLFVHLTALAVLLLFLCDVVPFYATVLEEKDISLPRVTVGVIGASRFLIRYWHVLLLAVIVLDGVIVFLLHFAPPRRAWLKSLWSHVFLAAVLLSTFFAALGLSAPFH